MGLKSDGIERIMSQQSDNYKFGMTTDVLDSIEYIAIEEECKVRQRE